MKNNLHWWLIVLNCVAVFFVLQIVFDVLPLWVSAFPYRQIESINNLIVDICIGIFTSTLFYYLLVCIPEKKKEKSIRILISSDLKRIASHMQLIIAYSAKKYSFDVKDLYYKEIEKKEFEKIKEKIYLGDGVNCCEYKLIYNDQEMDFGTFFDCFFLEIDKKFIVEIIDRITSIPNIIYEDETLIHLLYDIKKCLFFLLVDSLCDRKSNGHNMLSKSTPFDTNPLMEYHKLYVALLRFTTPEICRIIKV